ncbi:MAG TPA: hypothetical protein VEL51_09355 [Vicinamibacterales bacterium]|nr:hypothetical protein [Vicinamibacterales bacterium]
MMRARFFTLLTVFAVVSGCRSVAAPMLRFAAPGTDIAALRNTYPLSDAERLALTPGNLRALTQEQVDQIYARLTSGPIPDGPFRGDLFFPRDRSGHARIRDLADPAPGLLAHVAALRAEHLGRLLWKGKVFFRSQRLVRNRIDDLLLLRPIFKDSHTIPKLTFDGETTWLLFPARLSCGESRFDPTRPSIVVDYSEGPTLEGYRPVPDKLAGPDALNIRDEVRIIRPGFYLGRAYFGKRFALNFTLVDPAIPAAATDAKLVETTCDNASASRMLGVRK